MDEITRYENCFVCGELNQAGLQARFYYDGNQAITELTAEKSFEGYFGIYHGGILSTLLDEVMIKSILAIDVVAVTVEMTVKFITPVQTGDRLRLAGRVISKKRRLYLTEGEVTGEDGKVFATATGKYLEAKSDLKQQLLKSLDQK
jgi:uncharacterized protein (TIGR00369 family)